MREHLKTTNFNARADEKFIGLGEEIFKFTYLTLDIFHSSSNE